MLSTWKEHETFDQLDEQYEIYIKKSWNPHKKSKDIHEKG